MSIKFIPISLILLFIGLLNSCINSGKKEEESTHKKELVLALGDEPEDGFDPTRGWGRYGSPLFQSTLFRYDQDFEVKNDLATGYEMNKDGLQWIVDIRDDVTFTDGEPLTAADVVFTFEKAKESRSVIDLTNLNRVEQNGDHQIIFSLKERNSAFLTYLITIGIVPKHLYDDSYGEHPVGSGMYELVKWDKGQQIIVKRNDKYYGKKPYFEKLTFLTLSEDAAFAAAKSGQIDIITVSPALAKNEVKGMKLLKLKTVDNRGLSMPVTSAGKKTQEGYPIGNPVTSDPAIRKAMNIGVDRNKIIQNVVNGYGTPAYTMVDHLPWWNKETTIQDADPETAKKILDEAGWKENESGTRVKDGQEAGFTVIYPSNDLTRQALALSFAEMMKALGISVKTQGANWNEIEKKMFSQPVLFGLGNHTPLELYNAFSSSTRGVDLSNPNYYSNPAVDAYFKKALSAQSQEEANTYWQKAQWDGETGFTYKGDAAWVWLVNLDHLFLVNENLELGPQKLQPHQHNWPITDFVENWHWKN